MSQNIRKNEGGESSVPSSLRKTNVLDHSMTPLHTHPSSHTSVKMTKKIGNTIFTVNGRLLTPETKFLTGKVTKNGWKYKWDTEAPHPLKIPVRGMAPYLSSTIGEARNIETELEAFNIYVTDNMLKSILFHTNEEIKTSQYYTLPNNFTHPLDLIELKAFIGIMLLSAAKKYNKYMKNSFIWEANDIYNTIISENRYKFIIQCLRFDKYKSQNMKKATDPLFGIRNIWNEFNKKCSAVYRPSRNCIIDELFVDYIGNVEYMMHVNEPQKSLLKAIVLCDSGNRYIMSGDFLVNENNNHAVLAECVVENLTKPIFGTNINITYGKTGFTSVNLAKKMFQKYKLTTVTTMNINQPEIPEDVIITENRSRGSSIFLYNMQDELQLCTYYSINGNLSILLSNVHFESAIKEAEGCPNVLKYYNSTITSVDSIKNIYYKYSCSKPTSNRQIAIFYTILDMATINSLHILNSNRSRYGKPSVHRVDFLYKLALDLIAPHAKVRMMQPSTTDSVKNILNMIKYQQQNLHKPPNWSQQNKDQTNKPNKTMNPLADSTPIDGKNSNLKPTIQNQQNSLKQVKSVQLTALEQFRKWNQIRLMSSLNIQNQMQQSVPIIPENFTTSQVNSMILPMYEKLPVNSLFPYWNIRRNYVLQLMQSLRSSRLSYNQNTILNYNILSNMTSTTSILTMHQMYTMQQVAPFVQQIQYPIQSKKY